MPARQASPRSEAAGVRKAPRHEIAVGGAPEGAAGAMGIWAGRACHGDLLAAVRVVALGQRIFVAWTLNARVERCARGLGVGLGADLARRCKRERCRSEVSRNGGARCDGGSIVPVS